MSGDLRFRSPDSAPPGLSAVVGCDGLSYHQAMKQDAKSDVSHPPALIEVTRGALVESRHRGFIAVANAEGELIASLGDVKVTAFYRSAAKLFQAVPLITSGAADHFGFTPRELAAIIGSHSGEDAHREAVAAILTKIGLDETALQCGTHMPFDEATAQKLRVEGKQPTILHNNCSGKHAGMLALARFLGAPIEHYLHSGHPAQRQIRAALAHFACVPADEIIVAVDGCSAPVFAVTVEAMARSYARLVGWEHSDLEENLRAAARRVVESMIEYPEMIGGTRGRLDTDLMRVARGRMISKVGAEGVHLLGVLPEARYPSGLGIAIKVEDGDTRRARDPVVIETLRQLGLLGKEQCAQLAGYARAAVRNHQRLEVGEVRPCFRLSVNGAGLV
jgi:L-asparaginase II